MSSNHATTSTPNPEVASRHQYRVTINGQQFPVVDSLPPSWPRIAQTIEDRGGRAVLERRLVTKADALLLDCFRDASGNLPRGYMVLDNRLITAWDAIAVVEGR